MTTHPPGSTSRRQQQRHTRSSAARRRQWLRLAGGGLALAIILGLVYILMPTSESASLGELPQTRALAGERMPNVGFRTVDGDPVLLSDFAGQPVLINAWATWCPPCKEEMPLLEKFYQQHKAQGLVLLAVNGGEEPDTVRSFLSQNPYTFPVVLDSNTDILGRLGIINFPTSIVVGADGIIKYIFVGILSQSNLDNEISAKLGLK